MNRSTQLLLIALAAGLAIGSAISHSKPPGAAWITSAADVTGGLWINAIRMTVVPLVVSLLASAVASVDDLRLLRRIAARAPRVYVLMLVLASGIAVAIGSAAFALFPIGVTTAAAQSGSAAAPAAPSFASWVLSLVPVNPIQAAAEGAMLPLVVFTVAFGCSLLFVAPERKALLVTGLKGIADAMLIVLGWVLWLAPAGVFALSLSLAAKTGVSAVGALGYYVLMLCVALVLVTVAMYPVAWLWGGVPAAKLWHALAPVQAIAISSRSSLATLPVLVESGEQRLGFSRTITGFVLPLTASVLRVSTACAQVIAALFVAHYYGVPLGLTQWVTLAAMPVLLSFSVPGVPNGTFIVMVPLFQALGLPVEAAGLLIAVDTIPDVFKTLLNVTAHMTAAAAIAAGADSGSVGEAPAVFADRG